MVGSLASKLTSINRLSYLGGPNTTFRIHFRIVALGEAVQLAPGTALRDLGERSWYHTRLGPQINDALA